MAALVNSILMGFPIIFREDAVMPYFVWIDCNGAGHPQKWADLVTVGGKAHPHVRNINRHEITDRMFKHTAMSKLVIDFPFVPIQNTS